MIKFYPVQLILIVLVFFTVACKDEAPTPACSEIVDLGIVQSKDIIPYCDFEVLTYRNQIGEEEIVSVNHPQQLNFLNIEKVSVEKESSCGVDNSIEMYEWVVSKKTAIITFGFNGQAEEIFIAEQGIGEVTDGILTVDYQLSFADELNFGTGETTSFMNLTLDDIELNNPTPTQYEYFENYNAGGFSFEEVFVNTAPADLTVSQIIFNIEEGLLGFIDKDDNVWKLID